MATELFDKSIAKRFGPVAEHRLSTGLLCNSPFWVPEANGAMAFGTMDYDAVTDACTSASLYHPVSARLSRKRKVALGCLWFSDFGNSTCGPYQELTVTYLVSDKKIELPWVNAFTPLAAQLQKGVYICEHILVLNNVHAIAYGRELHGFDKHMGELGIRQDPTHFRFTVSQDTVLTVKGSVQTDIGTLAKVNAMRGLVAALGIFKTAGALLERWHPLRVVTPVTLQQRRTDIFFRGPQPTVQFWRRNDKLIVGDSPVGKVIKQLGFFPNGCAVYSRWPRRDAISSALSAVGVC